MPPAAGLDRVVLAIHSDLTIDRIDKVDAYPVAKQEERYPDVGSLGGDTISVLRFGGP